MFQFTQFFNNTQCMLQYDNTHKSYKGFPVRRDVSLRLFASVYIVSSRNTSSTYSVEVSLGRLFIILCFFKLRFFYFLTKVHSLRACIHLDPLCFSTVGSRSNVSIKSKVSFKIYTFFVDCFSQKISCNKQSALAIIKKII